jgi:hypothetical protein
MRNTSTLHLSLIQEIDRLWEPVYPYLARQIVELYGRRDGNVLEIGPFCGVLFSLERMKIGRSFLIATFPTGMGSFFRKETERRKVGGRIEVIETDPSLKDLDNKRFDLVIFRGAFFFPFLFQVTFSSIDRVLSKNGMAFVGGGFGKYTPEGVIQEIGKRSRDLNLRIGKVEVKEEALRQEIEKSGIKGTWKILSEGGLWVIIKKETIPPSIHRPLVLS